MKFLEEREQRNVIETIRFRKEKPEKTFKSVEQALTHLLFDLFKGFGK